MSKILAYTADGKLTYCSASPENRGKGRCKHIAHINNGEDLTSFINRINNFQNATKEKVGIANLNKIDFDLPLDYFDHMTEEEKLNNYLIFNLMSVKLKEMIQKEDEEQRFFLRKTSQTYDPDEYKKMYDLFRDERLAYNLELEKFKEDHQSWYQEIVANKTIYPNESQYAIVDDFCKTLTSIDDKYYMYRKSLFMVDSLKKNMSLPKITKKQLKPEYKQEFEKFTDSLKVKTGWIGETALKNKCNKINITSFNQLRIIKGEVSSELVNNKYFKFETL